MHNIRNFWKTLWNEHADSDNMFVQIGRSNYTPLEFFLMIRDICKGLNLEKTDIVLDIGGGGWLGKYIFRLLLRRLYCLTMQRKW